MKFEFLSASNITLTLVKEIIGENKSDKIVNNVMDPLSATVIGGCLLVITACSFVGSTASNYFFTRESNEAQNEIKTDIKVMSSEIKGIGTLEVVIIGIVVFVISSICGIAIATLVFKKCRGARANQEILMQGNAPAPPGGPAAPLQIQNV